MYNTVKTGISKTSVKAIFAAILIVFAVFILGSLTKAEAVNTDTVVTLQIGSNVPSEYTSFLTAWNDAMTNSTADNPATLMLYKDVSGITETLNIPSGKIFTLDINGHKFSGAVTGTSGLFSVQGKFTVRSSAIGGILENKAAGDDVYGITVGDGSLTLECFEFNIENNGKYTTGINAKSEATENTILIDTVDINVTSTGGAGSYVFGINVSRSSSSGAPSLTELIISHGSVKVIGNSTLKALELGTKKTTITGSTLSAVSSSTNSDDSVTGIRSVSSYDSLTDVTIIAKIENGGNAYGYYAVYNTKSLIAENSTITVKSKKNAVGINSYVSDTYNKKTELTGCTVTAESTSTDSANYAAAVYGSNQSSYAAVINGGSYRAIASSGAVASAVKRYAKINSGIFSSDISSYVAADKACGRNKDSETKTDYPFLVDFPTASVTFKSEMETKEKYYICLEDAWNAAVALGTSIKNQATVTLLTNNNITDNSLGTGAGFKNGALYIPSGKYIILDLQSHVFSFAPTSGGAPEYAICVDGCFTISNSLSGISAFSTNDYLGVVEIPGNGTFNMTGGSISSTTYPAVLNESDGTVVISGGTVSSSSIETIYNNGSGTISVSGGVVSSYSTAIFNSENGTINISGGKILCLGEYGGSAAIFDNAEGTVNISGGTVDGGKSEAIRMDFKGLLTISQPAGNTTLVTSNSAANTIHLKSGAANTAILNITGGTVSNTSGGKVIYNDSVGNINISGGKILYLGEHSGSAAIFNNAEGTVNISGGTVDGGKSKAIQMDFKGLLTISQPAGNTTLVTSSSKTITIYLESGTANTAVLNITGGTVSNTSGGNVIYNNSVGNINISGGTVSAVSGCAIYNASTGKITVSEVNSLVPTKISCTPGNLGGIVSVIYLSGGETGKTVLEVTGGKIENIFSGDSEYYNYAINNNGKGDIIIGGGTVSSSYTGALSSGSLYHSTIFNASTGSVIVSGGTVSSATYGILNFQSGSVTISGGEVASSYNGTQKDVAAVCMKSGSNGGILTVSGGKISNTSSGIAIYINSSLETNICGNAVIESNGGIAIYIYSASAVSIYGNARVKSASGTAIYNSVNSLSGSITVRENAEISSVSGCAIYNSSASGNPSTSYGHLTVNCGTVKSESGMAIITRYAETVINGGTVSSDTNNAIYSLNDSKIIINQPTATKTLITSAASDGNKAAIYINGGTSGSTVLEINGGTIKNTCADTISDYSSIIFNNGTGNVVINGGNILSDNAKIYGIRNYTTGMITLSGTANISSAGGDIYLNQKETLTSSSFAGNPVKIECGDYINEGDIVVFASNDICKFTVTNRFKTLSIVGANLVFSNPAAAVTFDADGTGPNLPETIYFGNFYTAWNTAVGYNSSEGFPAFVVLGADVNSVSDSLGTGIGFGDGTSSGTGDIIVPAGKYINLDLSNHSISRNIAGEASDDYAITVYGNLYLNSGSETPGNITCSAVSGICGAIRVASGELCINNISITSPGYGIYNESSGRASIVSGTVTTTFAGDSNPDAISAIYNKGNLTVSGGTVSATGDYGIAIYSGNSSIVNINGGTVSSAEGYAVYISSTGKVTISKGGSAAPVITGNANPLKGSTIYLAGGMAGVTSLNISDGDIKSEYEYRGGNVIVNGGIGNVTVSGGTFTIQYGEMIINKSTGTVNISGGTFENIGTSTSGSIIENEGNGTITISGGTFTADSAYIIENINAGIINISGGKISSAKNVAVFNNDLGVINISGGEISTCNRAVFNRYNGTVNISGGTVSAIGALGTAVYNGSSGTINITGGTIDGGDGIAVYMHYKGLVTISGGKISSAKNVAVFNNDLGVINISGGEISTCDRAVFNRYNGTVNISGGTVSAIGALGTAVYNGSSGTINITGGTIDGGDGIAIYMHYKGLVTISQPDGNTTLVTSKNTNIERGTIFIEYGTAGTTALNITGGKIENTSSEADSNVIYNKEVGNIEISGGTVSAAAGYAIYNTGAGNVIIGGGEISAVGTESYAVYSLSATAKTVKISAGTVGKLYVCAGIDGSGYTGASLSVFYNNAESGMVVMYNNTDAAKVTMLNNYAAAVATDSDVVIIGSPKIILSSQTGTSGIVFVTYNSSVTSSYTLPVRTGYTVDGYYSGETKVINADGTLVKNVAGFTDSDGKWISKSLEEKTLSVKWKLNPPIITNSHSFDMYYTGISQELSFSFTHEVENLTYSYQWYKGSVTPENKIDGATGRIYEITNVSESGIFYAVITASDGTLTSTATTYTCIGSIRKAPVTPPTDSDAGSKVYTGETLISDIAGTTLYDITVNAGGIEFGSYDVVVTLKDSANYKWETGEDTPSRTVKFNITQADNSFTTAVSVNDRTYGEDAQNPTSTAKFGTVVYTYSADENGTYTSTVPSAAGTYWVKAVVSETPSFKGAESKTSFVIEKATVTEPTIPSKAYTGELLTADIPASALYSVTKNDGGRAKGDYDVILTLTDSANYRWATDSTKLLTTVTLKFSISKSANSWTSPLDMKSWIYGSTPETPTATSKFGTPVFSYYTSAGDLLTERPSDVGNYIVKVKVVECEDYAGLAEVEKAFSISALDIKNADVVLGNELTYNGNEQTKQIALVLIGSITPTYTVSGNAATDAGTYTMTLTGTGNFKGTKTVKYEIRRKSIKYATIVLGETNTYTGERLIQSIKNVICGGLDVEYTVRGNANVSAGTYTLIVSGIENFCDSVTVVYKILPKNISSGTVSLGASLTYNGLPQTQTVPSVTVDGKPVTYKVSGNLQTEAGTYSLTVTGTGNFTGSITQSFEIAKADISSASVTLGGALVYNGQEQTQGISSVTLSGISAEYTVSGNTATNAGAYTMTLTGTGNFTGTLSQAWSIKKAVYDISNLAFPDTEIKYDGNSHSIKATGVPDGVSVSYSGGDKTQAGRYTITASFTGNENYEAIPDMTATLTILESTAPHSDTSTGKEQDKVIVIPGDGAVKPEWKLIINIIESNNLKNTEKTLDEGGKIGNSEKVYASYDLKLTSDGAEVQPMGNLTIKLLIPENLRGKSFRIYHIHGVEIDEMDYTIEGIYAVVVTDKLSEFIFVGEKSALIWLFILIIILILIAAAYVAYRYYKKRKMKNSK